MAMTLVEIFSDATLWAFIFTQFLGWAVLSCLLPSFESFKGEKDKPQAAAQKIIEFVSFVVLACTGSYMWWFDAAFVEDFAGDKVFGGYDLSRNFVIYMVGFQFWDFTSSVVCGYAYMHIIHHFSVFVLCLIVLMNGPNGFLLYYAPFFLGVTEISSVPLAVVDVFRTSKPLAKSYAGLNELSRSLFAVTFLAFRGVYWPVVVLDFFRETWASEASAGLLATWYIACIGLTGLQYYWAFLIIKGAVKMAQGKKDEDDGSLFQEEGKAKVSSSEKQLAGPAIRNSLIPFKQGGVVDLVEDNTVLK
jgi:hypothetical protein